MKIKFEELPQEIKKAVFEILQHNMEIRGSSTGVITAGTVALGADIAAINALSNDKKGLAIAIGSTGILFAAGAKLFQKGMQMHSLPYYKEEINLYRKLRKSNDPRIRQIMQYPYVLVNWNGITGKKTGPVLPKMIGSIVGRRIISTKKPKKLLRNRLPRR